MPPIKLNVTLLTPDALDAAIKTVAGLVTPSPPAGLTDKHRWMQCTVMNETQFPLVYQGTYYSSGKYWTAPCSMASFQEIVFSVCNGDGTFLTGATGGTAFNLVLDTSHIFQVAFGWATPNDGAIKAGVRESSNAEDGYNDTTAGGNTIKSANMYFSTDLTGKTNTINFHVTAVPGQETKDVITQVIIN